MLAYLNAVSSAPPARKGEYETGPVSIGIAVEDSNREIVRTCLVALEPVAGCLVDFQWLVTYGMTDAWPLPGTVSPEEAVRQVREALADVEGIAGHFLSFHRRQLEKLIGEDSPTVIPAVERCTMALSKDAVGLPDRWGKNNKPPSLAEAVHHYTGQMRDRPDPRRPWRQAQLDTLTEVRRVWWGINGWGLAPAVSEVSAEP